MVAIQKVEYDNRGQILPPRKSLQRLRQDLNGEFTANPNHWHRHTLAANNRQSFDKALAKLKADLNRISAEVIEITRSGPTVVDVFYLVEDKQRTAKMLREVARGNCPPELSLNELSPAR